MSDEHQNPYETVLADLERQRDQISATISTIRRMMGLSSDEGPIASAVSGGAQPGTTEIRKDTFFGMIISEAVKKYLAMAKRPMRATEIARALDEGGLLHGSKNWLGTVQTTLTRMKGTVVRVPNGWGLTEWYPGRNFDKGATQPPKRTTKKRKPRKAVQPLKERTPTEGPDASRQLQGHYLNLLKKVAASKREHYKAIAKQSGREQAIKAMRRDLGESE